MGNPKKPTALRELHGTAHRNKQRNPPEQPAIVNGIGQAPIHFTEEQIKIWDYLVGIMFQGVLSESDRASFELMTVLFFRFRHGTYEKESIIPALNGAELSRLDSLFSRYGMTPSDRAKISVPKQKPKNSFESI